jgi:hypothetical protein
VKVSVPVMRPLVAFIVRGAGRPVALQVIGSPSKSNAEAWMNTNVFSEKKRSLRKLICGGWLRSLTVQVSVAESLSTPSVTEIVKV